MRLVTLVESADHVCTRYRVAPFRAPLNSAGISLDIHTLPQGPWGRMTLGAKPHAWDTVILQRKLLPHWALVLLRRRVRKLIFDFDDAVWLRDSYATAGFDDPKRLRRFRATIAACDLVVAGNDYLAAEAARYTTANRVVVIPTCVEPAKYNPVRLQPDHPLQLVWVGSQSTLRGLERFTQTLSAIGEALPGIRLKLICDRFLAIPGLPIDACAWHEATEAAEIATADIGITWIPDDPWSRGKCGLKVLQYQAAGLPVVANPVGVHSEFVRNDITGYTAASTEEWITAIRRLSADRELRTRLGDAGRQQVEARYSVAAGARAWMGALERMMEPLRHSG